MESICQKGRLFYLFNTNKLVIISLGIVHFRPRPPRKREAGQLKPTYPGFVDNIIEVDTTHSGKLGGSLQYVGPVLVGSGGFTRVGQVG